MSERRSNRKTLFLIGGAALLLTMCSSLDSNRVSRDNESRLRRIERNGELRHKTEKIFGDEAPEKFYIINGNRAYLEIDGIKVEDYFNKQIK